MAASCGSGERSRTGGDSRPPARSGGSASRRGAAAAAPVKERIGRSLTHVPAADSMLVVIPHPPPPPHLALPLRLGAAAELECRRGLVEG